MYTSEIFIESLICENVKLLTKFAKYVKNPGVKEKAGAKVSRNMRQQKELQKKQLELLKWSKSHKTPKNMKIKVKVDPKQLKQPKKKSLLFKRPSTSSSASRDWIKNKVRVAA